MKETQQNQTKTVKAKKTTKMCPEETRIILRKNKASFQNFLVHGFFAIGPRVRLKSRGAQVAGRKFLQVACQGAGHGQGVGGNAGGNATE